MAAGGPGDEDFFAVRFGRDIGRERETADAGVASFARMDVAEEELVILLEVRMQFGVEEGDTFRGEFFREIGGEVDDEVRRGYLRVFGKRKDLAAHFGDEETVLTGDFLDGCRAVELESGEGGYELVGLGREG